MDSKAKKNICPCNIAWFPDRTNRLTFTSTQCNGHSFLAVGVCFQLGVPLFRRLLVSLSLRRPGFVLSSIHVGIVVDKLVRRLILVFVPQFLSLITFHQCYILIYSWTTKLSNLRNSQHC